MMKWVVIPIEMYFMTTMVNTQKNVKCWLFSLVIICMEIIYCVFSLLCVIKRFSVVKSKTKNKIE